MLHVVRREPRLFGIEQSRWTLEAIHRVCDWLATTSPGGLCRLLGRLRIGWKASRDHVHSPDDAYLAKLARVAAVLEDARASGGRLALVYLDELTYHRQPSRARAWEAAGRAQPRAERGLRADTPTRVVAALDALDARVAYRQRPRLDLGQLVAFHRDLVAAYPGAERIYVVQDNWPVHAHPDVLVALEPQEELPRWPRPRPASWPAEPSPAARRRWGRLRLPIQLLPLPTYASWTNPIEKLWRKLKQDVLHLHRLADRLDELRRLVAAFLDQFAHGSPALLRYVGLERPA